MTRNSIYIALLEANNYPSDLHRGNLPSFTVPPNHPTPTIDAPSPMTVQISFRVGEQFLKDLDDRIIGEVLQRSNGNKPLAAKHLGVTRCMLDR